MIRALLAGTKTQTRRVVKPQPTKLVAGLTCIPVHIHPDDWAWSLGAPGCSVVSCKPHGPDGWALENSPYGQPGDRLWVRETFMIEPHPSEIGLTRDDIPLTWDMACAYAGHIHYRADALSDAAADGRQWKPSIFMPRAASRLTLEITGVCVERLQDISEADAIAEGVTGVSSGGVTLFTTTGVNCFQTARDAYAALWESINGPGSWDANPWVWVVEFSRVTP